MAYILGISGSPKRGGITERLLDSSLEGAKASGGRVEKIILNDLNFKPCQECGDDRETGTCELDDDMQLIYKKFDEASGLVIASPIFFGSVSAQLKMMIDRFQSAWVKKYVLKTKPLCEKRRKGIFLCVGGHDRKEYFDNAKQIIKILFMTLDIEYINGLFYGGYNIHAKDLEKTEVMLKKAFELGKDLAKELKE